MRRENWCNIHGSEISREVIAKLPDKPFGYFKQDNKVYAPTVYELNMNGDQVEAVICVWTESKIGFRKAYFALSNGEYIKEANMEDNFNSVPAAKFA